MTLISCSGIIPETPDEVVAYFVYGTLCRGQCRQHCWPIAPLGIHPAWARGTLYGREDYPALRPGNERVGGECWFFNQSDAARVTEVLDEIEVTNQPGHPNLYDRVELQVNLLDSPYQNLPNEAAPMLSWTAFAYHYATDPLLDGFQRMPERATEAGKMAVWPAEKWRRADEH
jgi:gamma-glutamylcyclotransferase (GGCT)/AIG2-like uncharacterized protein YtfP